MALESVLRWAWLISVPAVDLLPREVVTPEMSFRDAPPWKEGLGRRKKTKPTPQDYLLALGKFLRERPLDVPTRATIARIWGGMGKFRRGTISSGMGCTLGGPLRTADA
jgi:hypothetical protein